MSIRCSGSGRVRPRLRFPTICSPPATRATSARLETLADSGAPVALLRLLQGPRYRVNAGDLAALSRHRRTEDAPHEVGFVAGLAGSIRCGCSIPPGAVRMAIGYYPLFENSTVRAEDNAGHSATFKDLGQQVDPLRGVVGLLFRAGDMK